MQQQPNKIGPTRRMPTSRQRNATPQSRRAARPTPAGVVSAVVSGDGLSVVVTYDVPVVLTGTPRYGDDVGLMPSSAALTSPTTVTLTYPAAAKTYAQIGFEDPAVRTSTGGFVNAARVPLTTQAAAMAFAGDGERPALKAA